MTINTNISKRWLKNKDSDNYQINIDFLKDFVQTFDQSPPVPHPWVFSHIPKTAGTSLENYLLQMFLIQETLHVNAPDLNKMPEVVHLKNKFPRFITGHHPIHGLLYQLLPRQKFIHITMIREPVARVVSYYNYLSTRNDHALHKAVENLSFDEFLLQTQLVELHNGQARRLAGVLHSNETICDDTLFNRAKFVVDNCFTLVGVTEKFDAFLDLIAAKYKVKFNKIARKNQSVIKLHNRELNNNQIQLIEESNSVDIKLYTYVYEKLISKMPNNLIIK